MRLFGLEKALALYEIKKNYPNLKISDDDDDDNDV
jgi:hypothetical protein